MLILEPLQKVQLHQLHQVAASTQTTVAPIANIAITGAANYIGTQIYESGGLATIGVVPEKIKNLSPLAYIKTRNFFLTIQNSIHVKKR